MGRDCWWNRNASTRVIQFGAPWKWTHKNTIVQSKKLAEGVVAVSSEADEKGGGHGGCLPMTWLDWGGNMWIIIISPALWYAWCYQLTRWLLRLTRFTRPDSRYIHARLCQLEGLRVRKPGDDGEKCAIRDHPASPQQQQQQQQRCISFQQKLHCVTRATRRVITTRVCLEEDSCTSVRKKKERKVLRGRK